MHSYFSASLLHYAPESAEVAALFVLMFAGGSLDPLFSIGDLLRNCSQLLFRLLSASLCLLLPAPGALSAAVALGMPDLWSLVAADCFL
jgi:hypothetical protein